MNEAASQDIPVWVVVLIPFAFLVVFATTWCLVMWILSRVSGWSRLMKSFDLAEEFLGFQNSACSRRSFTSRQFGKT